MTEHCIRHDFFTFIFDCLLRFDLPAVQISDPDILDILNLERKERKEKFFILLCLFENRSLLHFKQLCK